MDIFAFLIRPAGGALSPFDGLPVYTRPTGMMAATIGLAIKGGAVTALPVATVAVLTLLRPLTGRYWRFTVVFTAAILLSFLGGAAFGYYILLPTAMKFLLSFGAGIAIPVIDISEYLDLFMGIVFWTGVIFTLPPVMYLVTKFGFVKYSRLRKIRRFVPPFALIFAGILTPTADAVNLMLMAAPMIALYEVGLFVSWVARPEDGNYLWLKTIAAGLKRLRDALTWPYRKAKSVWRAWCERLGISGQRLGVYIAATLSLLGAAALAGWLLWDELLELNVVLRQL